MIEIRYIGNDVKWFRLCQNLLDDLLGRSLHATALVFIDGEYLPLDRLCQETQTVLAGGAVPVIVLPRGVPQHWHRALDGRAHFVTGKRNLQTLRFQVERLLEQLAG